MASGVVYGIDFGTSNSALAIGTPDGRIHYVSDVSGVAGLRHQVHTAVCSDPGGTLTVGWQAVNRKQSSPELYVDNFKGLIGQSGPVLLGRRQLQIKELVTAVLAFLCRRAKEIDPADPEVVVLTVPASWNSAKKAVIRAAAIDAGLGKATIELMAEPAAAGAYVLARQTGRTDQGRLLVYDLGGGTFDCAVAEWTHAGELHVLDYGGCPSIGGGLFDEAVLDEVRRCLPRQTHELFTTAAKPASELLRLLQLRDSCERLKCRLSDVTTAIELFTELGPAVEFELTRSRFDELIRQDVAETVAESDRLLKRLEMSWSDLTAVVPVGGSSVIPLVRDSLRAASGPPPLQVPDSHLATVNGALLRARALSSTPGRAPTIVDLSPTQGTRPAHEAVEAWEPINIDTRRAASIVDEVAKPPAPVRGNGLPGSVLAAVTLAWAALGSATAIRFWSGFWLVTAFLIALGGVAMCATMLVDNWSATRRSGAARRKSERRNNVLLLLFVIPTVFLGAVFELGSTILYSARGLYYHQPGNLEPALLAGGTLAAGGLICILMVMQDARRLDAGRVRTETDRLRERKTWFDSVRSMVTSSRWIAPDGMPAPAVFRPLLEIPGARAVALQDPIFPYALACGPRVLFVHVATTGGPPPNLDSTLESWRRSLQDSVVKVSPARTIKARAVVLTPDDGRKARPAHWSLEAGALFTQKATFAAVAGPFLAVEPYYILVPAVAELAGVMLKQAARRTTAPRPGRISREPAGGSASSRWRP